VSIKVTSLYIHCLMSRIERDSLSYKASLHVNTQCLVTQNAIRPLPLFTVPCSVYASSNRARIETRLARTHNDARIPFRLSDSHPNLDAWMPLATHSTNLGFIPQPVNTTGTSHVPPLVITSLCTSTVFPSVTLMMQM
jgi:hypothetical protein